MMAALTFTIIHDMQEEMVVRRYRDGVDYPLIESWYKAWNMPVLEQEYFSTYGIIVDDTVAAWLYITDSKLCMIENTISAYNSDKEHRRACIIKAYDELFKEAKRQGFNVVLGYTDNSRIAAGAESFGCSLIEKPIYLVVKNLKGS